MKKVITLALAVVASSTFMVSNAFASVGFKDVLASSPYAPYITDLQARGLVAGNGNGTFTPDDVVTRAQFVTMAVQAFGFQKSQNRVKFADSQSHWAASFIQAGYENGLISGTSDITFSPDSPVTNEQADSIVWRLLQKHGVQSPATQSAIEGDQWALPAVGGIVGNGLYAHDPAEVDYAFRGTEPMTRARAAALIDQTLTKFKTVAQPVIMVNPTSNPQNMISNSDGSLSMGNISMPQNIMSNQSVNALKSNLGLFSKVTFTTSGSEITVNVPATGNQNYRWILQGDDGQWMGSNSKSMTFKNSKAIEVGLIDYSVGAYLADGYIRYSNDKWIVAYPQD